LIVTFSYRIKDSKKRLRTALQDMASAVNYVWNFCNETSRKAWRKDHNWLSKFDVNQLVSGSSKLLPLHSQTIQGIAEEHATRRNQFKKSKLRWRSYKRSLGWIPFKASGIKLEGDRICYQDTWFRFWNSRDLPPDAKIKSGEFSQDARGRWYVNIKIETNILKEHGDKEYGIDLGLKDLATCSDGTKYSRENLTKTYEVKLAMSQRANKKRQTRTIHAKIKNRRKDWNHKISTEICRACQTIAVGKIDAKKLMKTKMAKSIADASWASFKTMLKYKAIAHSIDYQEPNEAYTTQTCSNCGERTGPKGREGLRIREWICSYCGVIHDRDVNAAINIFAKAFGRKPLFKQPVCNEQGQYFLFGLDETIAVSSPLCQRDSSLQACEK